MYKEYFGMKGYPFRLTPDTDFLYMSPAHSRAKAYMECAIFNREGFVVITGEIGSGKTSLIKKLLTELNDNVVVAKIFQTQLDEVELLQAILVEFGINPFMSKKVELLNMLNQFLINSYIEGNQVLLIIDDAQNLSKRCLEEITMLSGVETQKEKILHVILVGQPELNYTIESPEMEQLLQRVSLRFHVRPLMVEEIQEYVQYRLSIAGITKTLFTKGVYDYIYEYTGGIPRLINTLCDTALTCAYADNLEKVGKKEIETAVEELQWKKFSERTVMNEKYKHDHGVSTTDENQEISDLIANIDENISGGQNASITSLAIVKIANQLKRIADYLEKNKS
jgi:type II secretory pathway predicted ATPase ExeA